MKKNKKTIEIINAARILSVILFSLILLTVFTGCSGIFYIPGASYGYYIWEEKGDIFVTWSADRKEIKFEGDISTDGEIKGYELIEWEKESDIIDIEKNEIDFTAELDDRDYSDGIKFSVTDYSYIEFDLKMNNGYDFSRINVGGFLENPENDIFRIEKNYFSELEKKHFYEKRPFAEFFHKLFSNRYFTFLYILIFGVIVIEILRITAIAGTSDRKKRVLWILISFLVLAAIEVCSYFLLKFIAG